MACQALSTRDAIAVLDLELSEELEREGLARDLVRLVQQARRDAGLHVSDRIELSLQLPADARSAATSFADYIAEQTLATTLDLDALLTGDAVHKSEPTLGTAPITIALQKT